MDEIKSQLAAGNPALLHLLLAEWESRTNGHLADLQHIYGRSIDAVDINSEVSRQYVDVLALKSRYATAVEALESLSAELEDTETASELQLRLDDLKVENRKMKSSLDMYKAKVWELEQVQISQQLEADDLKDQYETQLAEQRSRFSLEIESLKRRSQQLQHHTESLSASIAASRVDPPVVPSSDQGEVKQRVDPPVVPTSDQGEAKQRAETLSALTNTVVNTIKMSRQEAQMKATNDKFKDYTTLTVISDEDDDDDIDDEQLEIYEQEDGRYAISIATSTPALKAVSTDMETLRKDNERLSAQVASLMAELKRHGGEEKGECLTQELEELKNAVLYESQATQVFMDEWSLSLLDNTQSPAIRIPSSTPCHKTTSPPPLLLNLSSNTHVEDEEEEEKEVQMKSDLTGVDLIMNLGGRHHYSPDEEQEMSRALAEHAINGALQRLHQEEMAKCKEEVESRCCQELDKMASRLRTDEELQREHTMDQTDVVARRIEAIELEIVEARESEHRKWMTTIAELEKKVSSSSSVVDHLVSLDESPEDIRRREELIIRSLAQLTEAPQVNKTDSAETDHRKAHDDLVASLTLARSDHSVASHSLVRALDLYKEEVEKLQKENRSFTRIVDSLQEQMADKDEAIRVYLEQNEKQFTEIERLKAKQREDMDKVTEELVSVQERLLSHNSEWKKEKTTLISSHEIEIVRMREELDQTQLDRKALEEDLAMLKKKYKSDLEALESKYQLNISQLEASHQSPLPDEQEDLRKLNLSHETEMQVARHKFNMDQERNAKLLRQQMSTELEKLIAERDEYQSSIVQLQTDFEEQSAKMSVISKENSTLQSSHDEMISIISSQLDYSARLEKQVVEWLCAHSDFSPPPKDVEQQVTRKTSGNTSTDSLDSEDSDDCSTIVNRFNPNMMTDALSSLGETVNCLLTLSETNITALSTKTLQLDNLQNQITQLQQEAASSQGNKDDVIKKLQDDLSKLSEQEQTLESLTEERDSLLTQVKEVEEMKMCLKEREEQIEHLNLQLENAKQFITESFTDPSQALFKTTQCLQEDRHIIETEYEHRLTQSESHRTSLERQLEDLTAEMDSLDRRHCEELEGVKAEGMAMERELKAKSKFIEEQTREREVEREESEKEIDQLKERVKTLQSELNKLTAFDDSDSDDDVTSKRHRGRRSKARTESQSENESMSRDSIVIGQLEGEREKLRETIEGLEHRVEEAKENYAEMQKQIEVLTEQLEESRLVLEDSSKKIEELETEMIRMREFQEELQRSKKELESTTEDQLGLISSLQNDLHSRDYAEREQIKDLTDQLEEAEEQLSEMRLEVESTRSKVKLVEQHANSRETDLLTQLEVTKTTVTQLQMSIASKSDEISNLREDLTLAKQKVESCDVCVSIRPDDDITITQETMTSSSSSPPLQSEPSSFVAKLQQDIADREAEIETYKTLSTQFQSEFAQFETRHAQKEAEARKFRSLADQLSDQLAKQIALLAEREVAIEGYEKASERIEADFSEYRELVANQEDKIDDLENRLAESAKAGSRVRELERLLKEKDLEVDGVRDLLDDREEELERMEYQVNSWRVLVEGHGQDMENKVQEISTLKKSLETAQKEVDSLKAEATKHHSNDEDQEELLARLEDRDGEVLRWKLSLKETQVDLDEVRQLLVTKKTELSHLQTRVATLEEENVYLKDSLRAKEARVTELEEEVEEHESNLAEARYLIDSKQEEVDETREQFTEDMEKLQSQIVSLQEQIDLRENLLEEENKELRDQIARLTAALEEKEDNEDSSAKIDALQQEIDQLTKELELRENSRDEKVEELQAEICRLECEISTLKGNVSDENNETLSELQEQIIQYEADQETLESELITIRCQLADKISEIGTLTSLVSRLEELNGELKAASDDASSDVERLRNRLAERDVEARNLGVSNEALTREVGDLRDVLESRERELARVVKWFREGSCQEAVYEFDATVDLGGEMAKVSQRMEENANLIAASQAQIIEKDAKLVAMNVEISSLLKYQNELQSDYDTVHAMLEDKEDEMEEQSKEDQNLQQQILYLQQQLNEKQNVIEEKEEEKHSLMSQLEVERAAFCQSRRELDSLQSQLEAVKAECHQSQGELESLQSQLKVQELEHREISAMTSWSERLQEEEDEAASKKESELRSCVEQLKEDKDCLIEEVDQLKEDKEQVIEELEQLKTDHAATVDDMEERLQNLQEENDALQSQLTSGETKDLDEESIILQWDETVLRRGSRGDGASTEELSIEDKEHIKRRLADLQSSVTDLISQRDVIQHQLDSAREEATALRLALASSNENAEASKHEMSCTITQLTERLDQLTKTESELTLRFQESESERHRIEEILSRERQDAKESRAQLETLLTQSASTHAPSRRQSVLGQESPSMHLTFNGTASTPRPDSADESCGEQEENSCCDSVTTGSRDDDHFVLNQMRRSSRLLLADDWSIPERVQLLLNRIKEEGIQLLSITEVEALSASPRSGYTPLSTTPNPLSHRHSLETVGALVQEEWARMEASWTSEREHLNATNQSLQDLISGLQNTPSDLASSSKWRHTLVSCVHRIMECEAHWALSRIEGLLTASAFQNSESANQIKDKITQALFQHRVSLDRLYSSERQSLVEEVAHLKGQLSSRDSRSKDDIHREREEIAIREREIERLLREVDVLSQSLRRTEHVAEDLEESLAKERSGKASSRSSLDRLQTSLDQLEERLASSQSQLSQTRDMLESETAKRQTLANLLEEERVLGNRLRKELDLERAHLERVAEENRERRDKIKSQADLAQQREQDLRFQLQNDQLRHKEDQDTWTREKSRVMSQMKELEVQLNTTKSQLSCAEMEVKQRQEELSHLRESSRSRDADHKEEMSRLEKQLDGQRKRIVQLESKLDNVQMSNVGLRESLVEANYRVDRVEQNLQDTSEMAKRSRLVSNSNSAHAHNGFGSLHSSGDYSVVEEPPIVASTASVCGSHPPMKEEEIWGRLEELKHRLASTNQSRDVKENGWTSDSESHTHRAPRNNMSDLLAQISAIQSLLGSTIPSSAPQNTGSSNAPPTWHRYVVSLSESGMSLARQNEELSRFVMRVSREKEELRKALSRLESEVANYRKTMDEPVIVQHKRTNDSHENTNYQIVRPCPMGSVESLNSLHSNKEMANGDGYLSSSSSTCGIKTSAAKQTFSRRKSTAEDAQETSALDAANIKIQRLYARCLRSESYRRALVYQKRYLLLVIGGFRETEAMILSTLASMDTYPSPRVSLEPARGNGCLVKHSYRFSRGMMRFRSAVRLVTAIFRMRGLTSKWHKAGAWEAIPGYFLPSAPNHTPCLAPIVYTSTTSRPVSKTTPRPPLCRHYLSDCPRCRVDKGTPGFKEGYGEESRRHNASFRISRPDLSNSALSRSQSYHVGTSKDQPLSSQPRPNSSSSESVRHSLAPTSSSHVVNGNHKRGYTTSFMLDLHSPASSASSTYRPPSAGHHTSSNTSSNVSVGTAKALSRQHETKDFMRRLDRLQKRLESYTEGHTSGSRF